MIVKELGIKNIEEIKELYVDIFSREPWNDDWSDTNQLHQYIKELIGNENSLTYGLFDEDEFIGIAMGCIKHWYSVTQYYVDEFCIKTEKQGCGVGKTFLKALEEELVKKDIHCIFLQTERDVPAFHFYEKNGFTCYEGHVSLAKEF